jgi:superfamily II DNA or RNA helicase
LIEIVELPVAEDVFDIEVEDCHNFFANGLLVHNCHQLMAPTYSAQLAGIYRKSRNFGFSATPYSRMDGAHARLEALFGPCLFELSYPEAVSMGLVVPIRVRWLPVRLDHNPASGKSGVPKKRWGIWRNEARNQMLAEAARSYADDQQTLILVETVEHLVHLWQHLKDFALMYGDMKPLEYESYVKSRMLPHDFIHMNPERRRSMRDAFERGELKKVIATDVWSTGVDFAQLAVLIRADERDSEILDQQGPGRVSRIYAGKEYGEVVDCIDYFDKGLQAKSRSRFRSYEALEWEQDWPRGRRQIGNPDVHTQRLF